MQKCCVLHQQHDLLGTDALPGGVDMARHNLLDIKVRVIQKTIGSHRLSPAMTRRRHTADWALAQPLSEPRQALRMPDIMPLALRQLCLYPVAHSHAPLDGE